MNDLQLAGSVMSLLNLGRSLPISEITIDLTDKIALIRWVNIRLLLIRSDPRIEDQP